MSSRVLRINDDDDVDEGVHLMGLAYCGFDEIVFLESAKRQVRDSANRAVRDYLAYALANCMAYNVHIVFKYCNLSRACVTLLADALEENTRIGGFTCWGNPFNFPHGEYNPNSELIVERAIIATRAPITTWNWDPLPSRLIEARRNRRAPPSPPQQQYFAPPLPPQQYFAPPSPPQQQYFVARAPAAAAAAAVKASEQLAAEDRQLATARAKVNTEQRELTAKTKEKRDLQMLIAEREIELKSMKDKVLVLEAHILVTQQAMDNALAVITTYDPVEGAAAKRQKSTEAEEDANLCGICFDSKKNRAFYRCGHQVCDECANRVMQETRACPFCKASIHDILRLF